MIVEQAMRTCSRCLEEKREVKFRLQPNGERRSVCRLCGEVRRRERQNEVRTCVDCGVLKLLSNFNVISEGYRRRSCRKCCAARAGVPQMKADDEAFDQDQPGDVKELEHWGANAFAPAPLEPLQHEWDVSCGMCGDLSAYRLTDGQARRLAGWLALTSKRCQRCGGWLTMERALLTVGERVDYDMGMPVDALEGPKQPKGVAA